MKSKFNVFSIGLILALILAFISLLIFMIDSPYEESENDNLPLWYFVLFSILGLGFVIYQAFTRINFLQINKDDIKSKNLLSQKKQVIQYTDLDEFIVQLESGGFKMQQLICLKKEHKTLLKISSFYYSNYEEMKNKLINTLTPMNSNVELYENLIDLFPAIERKGKTMPYTSLNGHMFSFLDKEGVMGLRLSAADIDAFIQEHDGLLMEQHGRIMKEYVLIPQMLLENTELLATYFKKSFNYVSSLKPKKKK